MSLKKKTKKSTLHIRASGRVKPGGFPGSRVSALPLWMPSQLPQPHLLPYLVLVTPHGTAQPALLGWIIDAEEMGVLQGLCSELLSQIIAQK